jgi:hypothetical protein
MRPPILACCTLVLAAVAAPAEALTTRCVDTVAELDDAYRLTQDDDVRINVVQGTYDLDGTAFDAGVGYDLEASLTIVGGYTNASCSQRVREPLATVFTTNGDAGVKIGAGGDIDLRSIAFRELDYLALDAVDESAAFPADHTLRLDRVRITSTAFTLIAATRTYITQSIVHGNIGGANCAMSTVAEQFVPVELFQVENSVFAFNAGTSLCLGDGVGELGQVAIYNTIFWDSNALTEDLEIEDEGSSSDVVLRNNIINSQTISPPSSVAPVGTLNADPQFLGGNDFRIANGSPARDSGTSSLPSGIPGTDIADLQRVVGAAIDRGAHENQSGGVLFNYTVTNTSNANAGSLRQALLDAEATPGPNGIVFAIPGAGCPKVITVATPLPEITQDLVIDGSSQSGSVRGDSETTFDAQVCVLLQSGAGLSPDNGLTVADEAPAGSSATVIGMGFSGFGGTALDLRGGGGHRLYGNQFGGTIGPTTLQDNGYAVRVTRLAGPSLAGTQIGGDDPNLRNLIGSSSAAGILLNGGFVSDTLVINNFIGLAQNGSDALGNGYGILDVGALDSTIRDNWIAGNVSDGVFLNSAGSYLQGNRIGLRAVPGGIFPFLEYDQPNGGYGIRVTFGGSLPAGNVLGSGIIYFLGLPTPTGSGNTIAYNGAGGLRADGGLGHRFSRNLVYANGGPAIDIGAPGYSLNDNDAAPGANDLSNRGLNAPVLSSAIGSNHQGIVQASLASINGSYRIELYSSSSCSGGLFPQGDARVYHGAKQVSIGNAPAGQNGNVAFTMPVQRNSQVSQLTSGRGLVAIAIDEYGNSSELSLCRAYVDDGSLFADGFESQ